MSKLKFCKDCVHSKLIWSNDISTRYNCNRKEDESWIDLVTGEKRFASGSVDCFLERLKGKECGKEGKYWKKK